MKILMMLFYSLFLTWGVIQPGVVEADVVIDDGDKLINGTWTPPVDSEDGTPFVDPANPTPDELNGYAFYCGAEGGPYELVSENIPVGVSFPFDIVPWSLTEVNECYVIAFDRTGNESGKSNLIGWEIDSVAPSAPSLMSVTVTVIFNLTKETQ